MITRAIDSIDTIGIVTFVEQTSKTTTTNTLKQLQYERVALNLTVVGYDEKTRTRHFYANYNECGT